MGLKEWSGVVVGLDMWCMRLSDMSCGRVRFGTHIVGCGDMGCNLVVFYVKWWCACKCGKEAVLW